jgi:uncharacterized protein YqjF (DUF2071 family)
MHSWVERLLEKLNVAAGQPWVVAMSWRDLFFLSWRVPMDALRSKVPPQLQIDTFQGEAWVSVVPMHVVGSHFRNLPPLPGLEAFRELNFRTYIKGKDGTPGVYFFTIDCPSGLSDWVARRGFGTPYMEATMILYNSGADYWIATERTQKDCTPASFIGKLTVQRDTKGSPAKGSIEEFLLERYALFYIQGNVVHSVKIDHPEWIVNPAQADVQVNTIPNAIGLSLPSHPDHVAYVSRTDTLVHAPVADH